jgi:dUTP pyrophosphatase
MTQLKFVNQSKHENPKYATEDAAGFDLRANIEQSIVLKPFERALIKTGFFAEIPKGHVGYVCTRSGLAIKKGLAVLNAPGVVDADYRGEICVILINLSSENVMIENGERIAQLIISEYKKVEFVKINNVEEMSHAERGAGGFGSTGTK